MSSSSSAAALSGRPERQFSQSSLSGEFDSTCKVAAHQGESNIECDSDWNTYLDWDLPDLVYQENSSVAVVDPQLAWYGDGFANKEQTISETGLWPSMLETSGQLWYSMTQPASNITLSGIREKTPIGARAFPMECSCNIYDPISLDRASLTVNEAGDPNPWLPKVSPNEQSGKETSNPESPEALPIAMGETEATLNAIVTAKNPSRSLESFDANKKRKLAHGIVERNYRSRINTRLADLWQCLPSTQMNEPRVDSNHARGAQSVEDPTLIQSSTKVAVLTDAIKYVKTLELRNRSLDGKLDILQRRHDLLEVIALSKLSPSTTVSNSPMHTLAHEDIQGSPDAFSDLKTRNRRKKSSCSFSPPSVQFSK